MTPRVKVSRWIVFLCLALGGAAFDLTTKSLIFEMVGPPRSAPVSVIPGILELQTSHNTGALWGFGGTIPHSSLIFASLSIVAGIAIIAWLFVGGAAESLPLTIALGLIMAGAMGNCYDRLVHGHVRDFAHFHIDPINFDCAIFNFADNMLIAGAVILVFFALRPHPSETGSGGAEPQAIPSESVEPV